MERNRCVFCLQRENLNCLLRLPFFEFNSNNLFAFLPSDEDTVLFGDQLSSLGVEALYEEGSVIVESCLNSSNDNSRQGNELEDDPFDQSEEQVHFFQTMHNAMEGEEKDTFMECCSAVENNEPQSPVAVAPVKDEEEEKVAEEEEEKTVASISNLLLKIEGIGGGYGNDSVVSTPDVLNDVITLESEGLCRKLKIEDSPFEVSKQKSLAFFDWKFL